MDENSISTDLQMTIEIENIALVISSSSITPALTKSNLGIKTIDAGANSGFRMIVVVALPAPSW